MHLLLMQGIKKRPRQQYSRGRESICQALGKLQGREDDSQRQSSLQKINLPQLTNAAVPEQPVLCHVEEPSSPSFWNTPFKVKINGKVLDATLDTGTSHFAVQADIVQNQAKLKVNVKPWSATPILLPDGGECQPLKPTWLALGFKGQCFHHHFTIVPRLPSTLILGMDFMLHAFITIRIPSSMS